MQGTLGVHTMPVAVIIDDRTDVWEKGHEPQIVQATAFLHYETAARAAVGDGASVTDKGRAEMERILKFLRGIRADHFHFWNTCLYPTVKALVDEGVPQAFWALDMHRLMSATPHVNVNSHPPAMPLPAAAMTASKCAPWLLAYHHICLPCLHAMESLCACRLR
jgi:hypothetical protein